MECQENFQTLVSAAFPYQKCQKDVQVSLLLIFQQFSKFGLFPKDQFKISLSYTVPIS
jgi:hypothetical protein